MDSIPERSLAAKPYRNILNKFEGHLVLPWKNPDVYTVLSVILSVPFLFLVNIQIRFVLLCLVLLLDWMDGAAARRFKGVSKRGYMVDVMFDRISDTLILASTLGTWYGNILFLLVLVNNVLTFYSIKTGKHVMFAVRFFYLIILIIQLINPGLIQ